MRISLNYIWSNFVYKWVFYPWHLLSGVSAAALETEIKSKRPFSVLIIGFI